MHDPAMGCDFNVRSPYYYVARTLALCARCRCPTPVIGLVVPPEHETLDEADGSEPDGLQQEWSVAGQYAFLFHVESLAPAIANRLTQGASTYRRVHGGATEGSYLANHCAVCGTWLEDQDLYCEPEGAFLPTSASAASTIHLTRVDESFAAAAGGYAYPPAFFAAMDGA